MRRLLSFSVLCFAMAIAPLAYSQTQVVVPSAAATTEGGSREGTALGAFSNTVHAVINESLLLSSGLVPGDVLTGLSFRVDGNQGSPIWSVDDYQIRLATSLNSAGNLNDDFTLNRGSDYTVVRSGPLSYDGTEYDDGNNGPGGSHEFGEELTFDTPFTYQGGDLLLEYTHSPIDNSLNMTGVQELSLIDFFTDLSDADGDLAQTFFGESFDATTRGFDSADGRFPVVQFTVAGDPELVGDFNDDNVVDCSDIDEYIGDLGLPAAGLEDQDLVADGMIDLLDVEFLVGELIVTTNGETGTFLGDFNCDGMVDVLGDAFILVGSLGSTVMSYSDGDANLDGTVNVLGDDFILVGNLGMNNTPPTAP